MSAPTRTTSTTSESTTITGTVRREQLDSGFTLIELLVVVLVLGILAAVAIPTWLGQRDSAYVAAVQADLHSASTAAETFAMMNGGTYAGLDTAALERYGYQPSEGLQLEVQPAPDRYVLTAVSTPLGSDRAWTFSSTTGTISG